VTKVIDYQRNLLKKYQVSWLKQSSDYFRDGSLLFLHGGPNDPRDQYLYTISKEIIPVGVRWLFSGHTHVQIHVDFKTCSYCNPGSVGQPRDGDPRAAYAIFCHGELFLIRVEYDIGLAASAMKGAGFEPYFYENLYFGTQIGGRVDKINVLFS
jgi:diadenosine tetraphosphatase ApaH/serine/threonine PP2A family protein phosphatase